MSRDALKTLFHPYDVDVLPVPAEGERYLFLGAEAGFRLPEGFAASLSCVQGFRPFYLPLEKAGFNPLPSVEGEDYDGALVLIGKHKGQNEAYVAEALTRVKVGGSIVIAGSKENGIQPLRKALEKLGLLLDHMPKYHGVVLILRRSEDISDALKVFTSKAVTVEGRFSAAPGMFSHDRIDAGSELLASRLPTNFDGNAADFGAGWGYLSTMLAEKSPATARIDLFEADHAALEFARANLARNCPKLTARFFWQDLSGEPPKEKYDLVIMNPPFHEAQAAEPALGQAFIRTAAAALRQGGELYMVANRGLPYETALKENFRESREVCRNARFKVLYARR